MGQTFPNELAKYRALRSNCYGTSSVALSPLPPSQYMSPSVTSLGELSSQQQFTRRINSTTSIKHDASSLMTTTSPLDNSQQQPNTLSTLSLLDCDDFSTVFASNSSNKIRGPLDTQ